MVAASIARAEQTLKMQAFFPGGRGRRVSGPPVLLFVVVGLCVSGCGSSDRAPAPSAETASPKAAETAPAPEETSAASENPKAEAGVSQPDVSLTNEKQLQQILDTARGKILVVNVWATWCLPCIKELPVFAKFYEGMDRDRVVFLSLSADMVYSLDDTVKPFVKEHTLPFPVHVLDFKDPDPVKLAAMIGASESGFDGTLPLTVVLDPDGKLVKYWMEEVTPGELEAAVTRLTGNTNFTS